MRSVKIAEGSMWVRRGDTARLACIARHSSAEAKRAGRVGEVKFYMLSGVSGERKLADYWSPTKEFLKNYFEISMKDATQLEAMSIVNDAEPPDLPKPAKTDDAYPDIIPTSLYGELVPKEGEVYIYHALNPRRIGERARIMRVELCDTALGSADRQAGRTLTYQVYYLVNTEIDLGVQCCSKESFRQSYRLHAPHSMVDAFTHERIADE